MAVISGALGAIGAGKQAGAQSATNRAFRQLAEERKSEALSGIKGLGEQAQQQVSTGFGQGIGTLNQASGRFSDASGRLVGGLQNQNRNMFQGFEQDPGFLFRQQQGEQAINRANSAQGGRLGGGALRELAQFNSGLASQEFNNFANRRLAQGQQGIGIGQLGLGALGQTAGMEGGVANMQAQQGQTLAQLSQTQAGQQLGAAGLGLQQQQAPNAGGGFQAMGNAVGQLGQLGVAAAAKSYFGP